MTDRFWKCIRGGAESHSRDNGWYGHTTNSLLWVACTVLLTANPSLAGPTPVPHVSGPVQVTDTSYPFGAAHREREPEDLSKIGYVEEEFFISGVANVYDWPQSGPAVIRTGNAPYTTRVLVRRPARREQFQGVAIVEMLNPSNLFDLNIGWAISHKELVRSGSVWVGITVKPVSMVTLKTFDAKRYEPLSLANPLPLSSPQNCERVAADSSRSTENGLAWDIFTQVGAWLRSRDAANPLLYGAGANASHPVRHLYAWGYSQTGSYLYTYVNAIQPLVVASDGKPMFDAYLIAVSSGPAPINQCAAALPSGDPRRHIRGAGVPVVRVMSQSDYLTGIASRREDSDTPLDLYRNYEIAGAAHATPDELRFAARPADIEKGGRAVPPMDCNEGPRSRFPNGPAFNAILRNLDAWVRTGTPAPRVLPIQVDENTPVLDEFGNVTGGIRSPYVDVPTSRWLGNSTGASFCRIAGHEVPLDPAALRVRFPRAEDYLRAVRENVSTLIAQRVLTKEDGAELIEEAVARAAALGLPMSAR